MRRYIISGNGYDGLDHFASSYCSDRLGLLAANMVLISFSFLLSSSLPFHSPPSPLLIELFFVSSMAAEVLHDAGHGVEPASSYGHPYSGLWLGQGGSQ